MSNVFLSTSFIYLASQEAGCLDDDGKVAASCDTKVHGFRPASFVSNVAVISGVLSALLMPVLGAMIDFTDHRRSVGIVSAIMIMMIQASQIGTVESTWFAMTILQAIAGFLFQAQVLAAYAYLSDMGRELGEETMTQCTYTQLPFRQLNQVVDTATFIMTQFGSEIVFLITVTVLGLAFQMSSVEIGQLGQASNAIYSSISFWIAWTRLPSVPASRSIPENQSLLTAGFSQIYHTARTINTHYSRGLRWYLLAVVFSEASANAFTVVSVIYLQQSIGLSGAEVGLFFVTVLISAIPGARVGSRVTKMMDPKRSWQLDIFAMIVWTCGGAIIVNLVPKYVCFIWGAVLGVLLGWFYATENLFFSMCLPAGQEAVSSFCWTPSLTDPN